MCCRWGGAPGRGLPGGVRSRGAKWRPCGASVHRSSRRSIQPVCAHAHPKQKRTSACQAWTRRTGPLARRRRKLRCAAKLGATAAENWPHQRHSRSERGHKRCGCAPRWARSRERAAAVAPVLRSPAFGGLRPLHSGDGQGASLAKLIYSAMRRARAPALAPAARGCAGNGVSRAPRRLVPPCAGRICACRGASPLLLGINSWPPFGRSFRGTSRRGRMFPRGGGLLDTCLQARLQLTPGAPAPRLAAWRLAGPPKPKPV